jgi:predicted  nucleic acid-binding Zn-ribbon protein
MSTSQLKRTASQPHQVPTPTELRALRIEKEKVEKETAENDKAIADIQSKFDNLNEIFTEVEDLETEVLRQNVIRAESLAALLDGDIPDNTPIYVVRGIPPIA